MKIGPRPALDLHPTTVVTQIDRGQPGLPPRAAGEEPTLVRAACLSRRGRPTSSGPHAARRSAQRHRRRQRPLQRRRQRHHQVGYQRRRSITELTLQLLQPFNGLFSGPTRVSRYQKGKTDLDFTGARDSEWQWNQLGHMQVCTSLQTDNHASTPPLCFLQAGCPSCRPTNSVKALKAQLLN